MNTTEQDFVRAMRESELIGNPRRAQEFFAIVETPTPQSAFSKKLRKTTTGLLVAVALGSVAVILFGLASAGLVDRVMAGFVSVGLVIVGTVVIFATGGKKLKTTPEDFVTEEIDPAVAIDAMWLEDVPVEVLEASTAQTRFDAASLAVTLTNDQPWITSVAGDDYDDPTFEARFAAARLEKVLAVFRSRR